jgi:hypothetical protein
MSLNSAGAWARTVWVRPLTNGGTMRNQAPLMWRDLTEEKDRMSIDTHLAALERRHQALDQEIYGELMHPSWDDLKIAELKRRKLSIKDEIAQFRQSAIRLASRLESSAKQKRQAATKMAKRKVSSWYGDSALSISISKGGAR